MVEKYFHELVKFILIQLYKILPAIKNEKFRLILKLKLASWRKKVFPPGQKVLDIAEIDKKIKIWVNVSELEGGNLFFGIKSESAEIEIFKKLVKANAVIFDIGANVGIYSLIASKILTEKGSVHAFEPSSFSFEILNRNVKLNNAKNIQTYQMAISDKSGYKNLFINQESGLTGLGKTKRGRVLRRENTLTTTVDEFVQKNKISSVDFLKIDVEGYEGHVLKGAKKLLESEKNLIIFCELSPKNYDPLKLSIEEVLRWMVVQRFRIWQIDSENRKLISPKTQNMSYGYQNYIFVREDSKRVEEILKLSF